MGDVTLAEINAYLANPWMVLVLTLAIVSPFAILTIAGILAGSEHGRASFALMTGWVLWQGAGVGVMILLMIARVVLK